MKTPSSKTVTLEDAGDENPLEIESPSLKRNSSATRRARFYLAELGKYQKARKLPTTRMHNLSIGSSNRRLNSAHDAAVTQTVNDDDDKDEEEESGLSSSETVKNVTSNRQPSIELTLVPEETDGPPTGGADHLNSS
ncbi:unnamed protein product [Discula destructiva]